MLRPKFVGMIDLFREVQFSGTKVAEQRVLSRLRLFADRYEQRLVEVGVRHPLTVGALSETIEIFILVEA